MGGALLGRHWECCQRMALCCCRGTWRFITARLWPRIYLELRLQVQIDMMLIMMPLCVSNFYYVLLPCLILLWLTFVLFIPLSFNCFPAACKTYYETVHRSFRYKQPHVADVCKMDWIQTECRQLPTAPRQQTDTSVFGLIVSFPFVVWVDYAFYIVVVCLCLC